MSGKKEKQPPQDLAALEDSYTIVGELSASDHVREYLATRTSDGADVQILVATAPAGDEGNALTLYAADVHLLASLQHRSLVPIHEGRWIAQDQFAVVIDRCAAPTIETLVSRGEAWAYPRIATILHEVNGLLEWARQQKVVHRLLTPETVHIEAGTDRVLASFIAQPLSRQGAPGPEGDARTIAQLAWTMITRGRDLPQSPEDSLGIVRPELPQRVIAATDALLHGQKVGETEPPAVLDYIGLVAMTDAIMRGEMSAAELEATVYQEQRLEREAWEAKERDYQEQIAEQERRIAAEREEMARTLQSEREAMEGTLASERAAMEATLAGERATMETTLTDEREEMTRTLAAERERMAAERAELEQQVASERAEMERTLAEERERLASERAELERRMADMEQHVAQERARLESTLSDEQQRMLEERMAAEATLAAARAEFEAEIEAQRQALQAQLAQEREEFDQAIIAERNALEADKEGFAVFNAAEREAIEAERRALEELYLAYEADGHEIVDAADHERDGEGAETDRQVASVTAALADFAPVAVAEPLSEPEPEPTAPAETEAGLTRTDAKRSRRASWGIPASVILLVGIITATAVGLGGDDEPDAEPVRQASRATQPAPARAAVPTAPTVIDSAGGAIVTPDSIAAVRRAPRASQPAGPPTAAPRRTGASPPSAAASPRPRAVARESSPAPERTFDTAVATPPASQPSPALPFTLPPSAPIPLPPATQPTTQPATQPAEPRDTSRSTPAPVIPSQFPQIPIPTIPSGAQPRS